MFLSCCSPRSTNASCILAGDFFMHLAGDTNSARLRTKYRNACSRRGRYLWARHYRNWRSVPGRRVAALREQNGPSQTRQGPGAATPHAEVGLVLKLRWHFATVFGELDHDPLMQPNVHRRGILHAPSVVEICGKLFAGGVVAD